MAPSALFVDRGQAGRRLAEVLPAGLDSETVVLGLARGGVPVAAQLAVALRARLDVLVVRKVGHPAQPEYALGAVSEDGVVAPVDLPPDAVALQLARARDQAAGLRAERPRVALEDEAVVLVDDGLATGRSMGVALETVARHRARRIVVAVPVASGPGLRELADRAEVSAVAVVEPPEFRAVGQFYDDFTQVEDEEVRALLL